MGAFKGLNRSDIFLIKHVASKSWNVYETDFKELGISKFYVQSGSIPEYLSDVDLKPVYIGDSEYESGSYIPAIAYQSLDFQFYRATQTGYLIDHGPKSGSYEILSGSFSGSYDISEQSTITIPGSRTLESKALVYSIPRSIFGTFLQMQSVMITSQNGNEYRDNEGVLLNGEGSLVGDVIYNKGLIIITDADVIEELGTETVSDGIKLSFVSNRHINTYNVNCNVKDRELNYTYNPTANYLYSSSLEFTPYVTSVGLYNNANELLAVAKFSKPIQKAANVDTTFKIQLDLS